MGGRRTLFGLLAVLSGVIAPATTAVASVQSAGLPPRTETATGTARPAAMVLILDASGSMNEPDGHGSTKIRAAKAAVKTIVRQLPTDLQVGLRVYGHRVPSSQKASACRDTQLITPVGVQNRPALLAAVDRFAAKGETPIGLSLSEAAHDLPRGSSGSIVLVSDGEDSCAPPQPCDVARQLKAKGLQVTVNTVGLKVSSAAKSELTCIATSTGGTYTDVKDSAKLASSLQEITQRAARPVTLTGTPVEGNPLPDAAPILTSGSYTDTVRSGETLYYGVRLELGQRAKGRFTVDGTKNPDPATMGGGEIHAVTADGDEYSYDNTCCHHQDTWALTADTGYISESSAYGKTAGNYYFKYQLNGYPASATMPIKIDITVTDASGAPVPGSPTDAASPTPTATGPSAADATTTATAAKASGATSPDGASTPTPGARTGASGFSTAVTVGVGAAGLVIGLTFGSILTAVIRSRRHL